MKVAKKQNHLIFSLLVLFCLSAFSCQEEESIDPSAITKDEYKIYSTIIEGEVDGTFILVQESNAALGMTTIQPTRLEAVIATETRINNELIGKLTEVNQDSVIFESKFTPPSKEVLLTSSARLSEIFSLSEDQALDWDEFEKVFGKKIYHSFSRIAFNEERTEALVGLGTLQSGGNGRGFIYYLKLESTGWVIKRQILTWIT